MQDLKYPVLVAMRIAHNIMIFKIPVGHGWFKFDKIVSMSIKYSI